MYDKATIKLLHAPSSGIFVTIAETAYPPGDQSHVAKMTAAKVRIVHQYASTFFDCFALHVLVSLNMLTLSKWQM